MIVPAIIWLLQQNAPVAQLTAGGQVYDSKAPQGTNFDYVVVRQSSGGHLKGVQGRLGFANPIVEVTVYAATAARAEAILNAISKPVSAGGPLDTLRNTWAPATGGVFIQAILQDESDEREWIPDIHAGEAGAHLAGLRFKVWHTE